MRNKNHNKAKSLHTVSEIPNTKTFFINRITQRSFLKSVLSPLPLTQLPQIQIPAPLSGRVVARKVIKNQQLKTQQSGGELENKQQQSIFKLIASAEFKNIITEEKSKKEDDKNFTLDGPLQYKQQWRQKIFIEVPILEQSFTQNEDDMNIQIFLKKVRQIMTTSHIQHNDIHTNENSFLSDKFKTQLTSPRFTFTNHLSTIQFQNQQTQLQKAGTIVSQMLDSIEEKKEQQIITIQNNRKKITISVCSPENQIGVFSFSVPDYGQRMSEQSDHIQEYSDKPKHVLKQALQFISQQPKKNNTKFSKSILKIVGITEEDNQMEDVRQFYNQLKTRRFMKMYLQNKMSRIFSKLEENILLHLQLIQEKRGSIQFVKPTESQQSSRLYSWCTIPGNSNHESLSNPTFYTELDNHRFLYNQLYQFDYSFEDSLFDDTFNSDEYAFDLLPASRYIKITNLQQYINFIISGLESTSRNLMLQDDDNFIDPRMIIEHFRHNNEGQVMRIINQLIRFVKKQDKLNQAKQFFLQYNDILTGIFEDEHEINNLTTDYGLIEVEEQQHQPIKIDIAKMFIRAAKPIKHKRSGHEHSPPSERSNIKQSTKIISSPRHQTLNQTTKPQKQLLLEATSSQTSVLRRRSDSPQEETSIKENTSLKENSNIKENSNTNTTQSNKMKATQTIQNTTAPISQKETKQSKSQDRRNAVVIPSMSKHSLQMRTQITEARRRQSIPIMEIVKLLIEEQKLTELEEVFTNNPNLPINERMKDGNTYLIVAAQTGNIDIVDLLLHKGAAVNIQNNEGNTALHNAIAYNFFNVADLLIAQGAQNLRNQAGYTPWQLVQ